jgi:formate-dependent nitrite reductase membrane component NrfD
MSEHRPDYYGRPVIKQPVWKTEIGWYFFSGGLGGAAATLALVSRLAGRRGLARRATLVSALALSASPPLLIKDLGRPKRFLYMFRVLRPTSPMSIGSWMLGAAGTAAGAAAGSDLLEVAPVAGDTARTVAGLLGPAISTYTAVLISDTSVPVWHEARRELPLVFAAGSAASAGAAVWLAAPADERGPARRLAIAGAAGELVAAHRMESALGELGEPYRRGRPGRYARAARRALAGGAALMSAGRRRPMLGRMGAGLILAGTVCERFAILRAGNMSADDPRYTVDPQRERVAGRVTS